MFTGALGPSKRPVSRQTLHMVSMCSELRVEAAGTSHPHPAWLGMQIWATDRTTDWPVCVLPPCRTKPGSMEVTGGLRWCIALVPLPLSLSVYTGVLALVTYRAAAVSLVMGSCRSAFYAHFPFRYRECGQTGLCYTADYRKEPTRAGVQRWFTPTGGFLNRPVGLRIRGTRMMILLDGW